MLGLSDISSLVEGTGRWGVGEGRQSVSSFAPVVQDDSKIFCELRLGIDSVIHIFVASLTEQISTHRGSAWKLAQNARASSVLRLEVGTERVVYVG